MALSALPPIDPKAVHNERLKLTASVLNTVAGATITVGVLTPLTAYLFDLQGMRAAGLGPVVVVGCAWSAFGLGLHWAARTLLGDLR